MDTKSITNMKRKILEVLDDKQLVEECLKQSNAIAEYKGCESSITEKQLEKLDRKTLIDCWLINDITFSGKIKYNHNFSEVK